ncbi:hypothetical protein Tco_1157832, partial [Tanacetum coccineum]
ALQVTDTGCRLFLVAGPLFLQFLGASCTQGTVSSIPIVGSISSEGFLSFILLLVVIIVTVVIVAVILVVVVVVIVGVVIVVAIIGIVVVGGFRGGNISFNASRQSSDESFQDFLSVRYHAWAYDR